MKYIAITFDDGRSDNYLIAKEIMDKYNLIGTVYITTGFIDGTWKEKSILKSPVRALNVDEIKKLENSGWEIGLHGDKHKTQVKDMKVALEKLKLWGIKNRYFGISIPNSVTSEEEIVNIFKSEYRKEIFYIRRGRKCNTTNLKNRVLFVLYSLFKWKWAYNLFNEDNIINELKISKLNIPSVVIKSKDNPKMIVDFIKKMPDNSVIVFMLHSIMKKKYFKNKKDDWSWSEEKFDEFCFELEKMKTNKIIEVNSLKNIILKLKGDALK